MMSVSRASWQKIVFAIVIFTLLFTSYEKAKTITCMSIKTVSNNFKSNEKEISVEFTDVSTELTSEEVFDETVVLPRTLEVLQRKLKCVNKRHANRLLQRGEFWVLQDYIKADHGDLACYQYLTYTTHSDFTFLDNLEPLIISWDAPVSVALHAPGYDLSPTVDSIRYLRDCVKAAHLIRKWVSFHIFFHRDHIPEEIPEAADILGDPYDCSLAEPFLVDSVIRYTANNSLLYPINVGRNIAREAALTHFIFPSDIELYPTPKLSQRFLNMIARNPPVLNGVSPRVFPLPVFEVAADQQVPQNKTRLAQMLKEKTAIRIHKSFCSQCHSFPNESNWVKQPDTSELDVFTVTKRIGKMKSWEPLFIGTLDEPMFEEKLSWEGKSDKMTQNYLMCVLNYDYMTLNNAFLTHKPGIKKYHTDKFRNKVAGKASYFIHHKLAKEYEKLYGDRDGCKL